MMYASQTHHMALARHINELLMKKHRSMDDSNSEEEEEEEGNAGGWGRGDGCAWDRSSASLRVRPPPLATLSRPLPPVRMGSKFSRQNGVKCVFWYFIMYTSKFWSCDLC